MRTSTIDIFGKKHLMCFSARVIDACTNKYGSFEGLEKAMSVANGSGLKDTLWFMSALLDAGDRYAKRNGIDNPPAPSFDDLLDCYGIDDLATIAEAITAATDAGSSVTVETEENSKNAKTTRGK